MAYRAEATWFREVRPSLRRRQSSSNAMALNLNIFAGPRRDCRRQCTMLKSDDRPKALSTAHRIIALIYVFERQPVRNQGLQIKLALH